MKSIIITLGGFGEFLRCRLEGKWLYQFATKPNLERLTGGGLWGRVYLGSSPERSYFSFWGGEKNNFPGESYLRCLAYDLPVNPEATLFLGKFLTHDRGTIVRADPVLSPNESALLLRTLAEKTTLPFSWHSLNGEAVISVSRFIPQVELPLPGDIKGHPYQQFLPRGKEYAPILSLVGSAASLLEKHPVNQVRLDLNEPLANFLWLWGTGHGNPPPRVNITDCPCFFSESRRLQGLALYLGCELHGDLANLEKTSAFWWLDFKLNPSGNFSAW
ncbi:MAG TPA: hypothetical protein PKX93_09685, partial [bacterium]|nr:hypothetical protein [bacterium]